MSDAIAALRRALKLGKANRSAVGDAVIDVLAYAGATRDEAARALAILGFKARDVRLIDLYQGAWLLEKLARDMGMVTARGTLKAGVMKEIMLSQASIWERHSGDAYSGDQFADGYKKWKKRTGGGGLSRQYRKGYEAKDRTRLVKRD